jgi:hypothetical protein
VDRSPSKTVGTAVIYCGITLIAAALMIFLYGRIDYQDPKLGKWDLVNYRAMALAAPGLDRDVPRPFAYRILGPYLAGLIGGHRDTGIYLVNLAFSVVLIVLAYRLMLVFGIGPPAACVATVLYLFNKHFFGFTTWNYFHLDDVLLNMLLIVAFWSMMRRRWVIFAVAVALAALAKEVALVMIPVALLALVEAREPGLEWRKCLCALAPAAACYLLLHILIRPPEGQTLPQAFAQNWTKVTSYERIFHVFLNPFVPICLVPLVFIDRTISLLRGRLHMLLFYLLVLATTLFGTNNERLLNPAAIVVYPLIGLIVQESILPSKGAVALMLVGGFLSSFHWLVARYPLPSRAAVGALSGGSMLVITAALVVLRFARRRKRAGAAA